MADTLDREEREQTIENIRLYLADIEETKTKLSTLADLIDEHLEGLPEQLSVARLENELAEARQRLKSTLMSDGRYNDLLEDRADLRAQLADQRQILSDHIVVYYTSTNERQIELGPRGDSRELIVTGKLGKEAKYQTNIFGGAGDLS